MKKFLFLALFLIVFKLNAQESIQTDRPDQTESPAIVPQKHLQVEAGILYEKISKDAENISHPTILWKYGVNDHFELRMETELASQTNQFQKISGLVPLTFGLKVKLIEEKNAIPTVSFLGHLTTNTLGSKKLQTNHLAPSFRFLFQHTLSERLNLGYNFGAEWNGESPDATGIYTISSAYAFSEKLGGFVEFYGFLNKYQTADHRLDAGLTYLLNNDLQLDISSGIGLSNISPDYFISCGISYRFPL